MPETTYYGGIHSIAKDSIGRIWFSGYDALFMYNGTSFSRMNDEVESLLPNDYWQYRQVITNTLSKRLYVATSNGLLRFDYNLQKFEKVLDGNIGSITSDQNQTMWLICDDRIESFHSDCLNTITRYKLPPDADTYRLALICSGGYVWVASGGKLYTLDTAKGEYNLFTTLPGEGQTIRDVEHYDGSVYILTLMDGLWECAADGRTIRRHNLPPEYEKSAGSKELYLDRTGIMWVATQSGLMLLDPISKQTRLLRQNIHNAYSLPNNSVWSIFPDPDGGVWVGTYGGKLAYMTFFDNDLNYFKATPGGLNHPIVSFFEEDVQSNLWIATEGGGLNYWDRNNGRFSYFTQESNAGINSNMIKKLWYDSDNTLYMSAFNGGMERFDADKRHFSDMHMYYPGTRQQLSVYDFVMDADGGIWMSNPDTDLIYRNPKNNTTEVVRIVGIGNEPVKMQIETMFTDRGGDLWLVTQRGIYVMDIHTRRIRKHYYVENAPYSVNNLCSYCIASDGTIWFGTRGGGLNRLSPDGVYVNFISGGGESLAGKTVFGILEDITSGNIWLSTNDGLFWYDHAADMVNRSEIDYPDLCGAYYVRACFTTGKGEMLFGGTDGFIMFTPGKIKTNNQKPRVYFTDLFINSERMVPGAKNSPLNRAIQTMSSRDVSHNRIDLSYRQTNIEIRFSSDSYLHAEKNRYEYCMAGLSERWYLLPRGQKSVSFFNLPAGNYTFRVRAANNDGLWGEDVSSLRFKVSPSPFLSPWAYLVYCLILFAASYFVWRFFTDRKIFRNRLELEQIKEQNMRELSQARINFFTNISHDLKTPLTLVVDPLKQLREQLPDDDQSSKAYVYLIEKNVRRIQRMISQLLQFREIESQKVTLNSRAGDIVGYLDSIFSLFELYANRKEIETEFNSTFESFYTRFDPDVIEKIFTNLISNAIKYTSEKGYVGVRMYKAGEDEAAGLPALSLAGEYIAVTITNTGAGIPERMKEYIFESFNRLSARKPAFEESTGLGLAIVRELVGYLDGKITVDSDNSRVSFTVVLPFTPIDKCDMLPQSSDVSYDYTISEIDDIIAESGHAGVPGTRSRKSCDMVVIEDDPDLRNYLEARLSRHYNVYTAANGIEGIAKVERIYPRVVITDLMMPGADGYDVCHSLRSNIKTSHIPVVVLSAAGKDSGNKIRALESGANVFIDKPVDIDYLLRQIDNLIRNQNELKTFYSKKYIAEPSPLTFSSMDENLLRKAMGHIENNMANADYSVEDFVSDMGIGRTLLYQKINDITGMSIKEFIMDIRLKRGAQMLKDSDLTISEIALLTGFNNPKYFSICFKKHFELTPSEFKRKS